MLAQRMLLVAEPIMPFGTALLKPVWEFVWWIVAEVRRAAHGFAALITQRSISIHDAVRCAPGVWSWYSPAFNKQNALRRITATQAEIFSGLLMEYCTGMWRSGADELAGLGSPT